MVYDPIDRLADSIAGGMAQRIEIVALGKG